MHVYFSGIGGAGIGPLAQIALKAGFTVSGSDKQDSQYIHYLRDHGIADIHIGQTLDAIKAVHTKQPIDWLIYSSAVTLEKAHHPELKFCQDNGIRLSKRDELLNQILKDKNLKMIAIAGTQGKTTTTAMVIWLLTKLDQHTSYLLPAKTSFAQMGEFDPKSQYFVYEADEFDRNFLAFEPAISLISGVSWDHHEIFHSREDYKAAFREFIDQSGHTIIWKEDADYLELQDSPKISVINWQDNRELITLKGLYNRLDGWMACEAVRRITNVPVDKLLTILNSFPGLSRRMEQIIPNLYSDYAHTPEKIRGVMSVASEMASETGQKVVIVYEPLTNRRQHYVLKSYGDCFSGASKIYWLPSYLAREDPSQRIILPQELISHLPDPTIAEVSEMGKILKQTIKKHLDQGDMVVGIAGGGGGSLDDWLRENFATV